MPPAVARAAIASGSSSGRVDTSTNGLPVSATAVAPASNTQSQAPGSHRSVRGKSIITQVRFAEPSCMMAKTCAMRPASFQMNV